MSDNSFQQGNRRRRRRPRSDRPDSDRASSAPRTIAAKQTGFQKFLSAISFGLLGKPSTLPAVTPRSGSPSSKPARPPREPRENREPREPKPRREAPPPPNPGDIATERLYVGNLSYDASESDLFELFNGVGGVRNAEVVVNNRTQRSKGFAFVTMSSVEEARRAVSELHGKEFMGRPLQLSGAKPIGSGDRRDDSESESQQVAA